MVTCRECGALFDAEVERAFLERVAREAGWQDVGTPRRCQPCRKRAREAPRAIPADADGWYELDCQSCGLTFKFGPADLRYYRDRGWPWPKRCRPCRAERSTTRR
jgi:hypothetical protein